MMKDIEDFMDYANKHRLFSRFKLGVPWRAFAMVGRLSRENGVIPSGVTGIDKSRYSHERHKYLLLAPFDVGSSCCSVMKKSLAHKLERNGIANMTAQMASESRLRTEQWIRHGCNGFDLKYPLSNPMSFWTEQDVLLYIRTHNIKIASVYGDVVEEGEADGQMNMFDFIGAEEAGLFGLERPTLKTTGCRRTGCVFCGFGCHRDKRPNRFELIPEVSNPALLDFCMRGGAFAEDGLWKPDNRGLGYWFVLKWINIHGKFNIYIPNYEEYEAKYGNELTRRYLYGEE